MSRNSKEPDYVVDKDKVDDTVLALLYLTRCDDYRSWKGHDWDALDRLCDKEMIGNPASKAKSVVFSEEGWRRSEQLFMAMFTKPPQPD